MGAEASSLGFSIEEQEGYPALSILFYRFKKPDGLEPLDRPLYCLVKAALWAYLSVLGTIGKVFLNM